MPSRPALMLACLKRAGETRASARSMLLHTIALSPDTEKKRPDTGSTINIRNH